LIFGWAVSSAPADWGVAVDGKGVSVGGMGVTVGGTGVSVGGKAVGGSDVEVGGTGACVDRSPVPQATTSQSKIIRAYVFLFIGHSFLRT